MARYGRIKLNKKKEERTEDISEMINEGGLGADYYYDIIKRPSSPKQKANSTDKQK